MSSSATFGSSGADGSGLVKDWRSESPFRLWPGSATDGFGATGIQETSKTGPASWCFSAQIPPDLARAGKLGFWFGIQWEPQRLKGVALPSSLQNLTFENSFDQSLECVTWPSSLWTLTFGNRFNQSLECMSLPGSLQSLTFRNSFNTSLERVTLPRCLHMLSFDAWSLERVTLPGSLQSLTFGSGINQSLERVALPSRI